MVLLQREKRESELRPEAARAVLPHLMLRLDSLFFQTLRTYGLPGKTSFIGPATFTS